MTHQHEQYEWANIWWNNADDTTLPRVLLIGDSISCAYSPIVTARLTGVVQVDRLGTSRSLNDPALHKETTYLLSEFPYTVIHFNNGLHGWHLDEVAYGDSLHAYVRYLQDGAPAAQLIWGSTTPVAMPNNTNLLKSERNDLVLRRNAIAYDIMAEFGIPVNDLYAVIIGHTDLMASDGVHYTEPGSTLLGNTVADAIRSALG